MTNSTRQAPQWLARVVAVALGLLFLTMLASWAASVVGLPVGNLLSEEGIRHMFALPLSPTAGLHCGAVCVLAMAAGAVGSFSPVQYLHHWHSLLVALLLWGAMLVPVWLLAFRAGAPLQSITGHLSDSPFLPGVVVAVASSVVAATMLFGVLAGLLRSWRSCVPLLYVGWQRYAPWLTLWLLAELWVHLLTFVLHPQA